MRRIEKLAFELISPGMTANRRLPTDRTEDPDDGYGRRPSEAHLTGFCVNRPPGGPHWRTADGPD